MTTDVGRGERAGSAATPGRTRDVIVNSTVAAVLATAVTIFVHELVHLVTGIVLGHGGTLYPFGVIHDGSLTDTETALTAISAPIASLVIGAAVIAALPRPATSRFGQLFLFWLGATSFMEGAGYLVITPMGAGDTAATLAALDLPLWVGFLAAALGVALMFLGARMLAPHVVRMSGRDRTISWAIAFHPWWIGTLVSLGLTAAYLALSSADLADGEVVAILSASTALLVLGPMSFIFQNRSPDQPRTVITSGISVAGVAALVAMVAVNFALVSGRHLG